MPGTEQGTGGQREPDPSELVALVRTGRVAAEATVERLQDLGIEALVHDLPNVFVRLASGGNYRVQVVVPAADRARAQAEIERWAVEAAPRVRALAGEVQRVLGGLTLLALALGALLFWLGVPFALGWGCGAWVAGTAVWTWRSRRRGAAVAPGAPRA